MLVITSHKLYLLTKSKLKLAAIFYAAWGVNVLTNVHVGSVTKLRQNVHTPAAGFRNATQNETRTKVFLRGFHRNAHCFFVINQLEFLFISI